MSPKTTRPEWCPPSVWQLAKTMTICGQMERRDYGQAAFERVARLLYNALRKDGDMNKLTIEQIEQLEAKARNCRNNARAEEVVSNAFKDEYLAGLSSGTNPPTAEQHRHMIETYDFYIGGQHRAKNHLVEAELFEAAASLGRSVLESINE